MNTVLVVTERTLGNTEVQNIRIVTSTAEEGPDPAVRVLVPAELDKKLWVEFLDQLALLDFKEAFDLVHRSEKGPYTLEDEARTTLEDSLRVLADAGIEAHGRVAVGDPVAAMREEVEEGADQILVITDPHPIEDTFNIHWANKAEKTLGVPVLHLIWGTEHIDD